MARSNTANGGSTYFDLVIQIVATSDTQFTLRAVVYLTSLNVSDSVNNLTVYGDWARSGALALGGVYNASPVWFQDIVVNRVYGSGVQVGVGASWSGVEYWGTTLGPVEEYYTVPARPVYPPSAPGTPSVTNLGPTSATLSWTTPSSDGGGAITGYDVQIDDSGSSFPSPEVNVADPASPYSAVGLVPGRTYYARVRAVNSGGAGAWSGVRTFTTLSGGRVRIGGAWADKPVVIRWGGTWVTPIVNKRWGGGWVL